MKYFCRMTLLVLLSLGLLTSLAHATDKPNLIVIMTDDQGYADVGFNGSTEIRTPHIDRIAGEGTRFTSGYVSYPVCGPSRAGFLTGRYQGRFGFGRNPIIDPTARNAGIAFDEKNIAEVLKPAGYTSGILGKWHMGTHPDHHPNKRGFDYFYGFLSGGHQYFPEELTLEDLSEVTKKYEWYKTRLLRNDERVDTDEYLTDEISHEAVDFIKRESHGPFFLYVAYNAPHTPLQASQEYLDRNTHIENKRRRTYAAMITAVDDGVGRILETLKEEGIDENTIVFFLSDNGGPLEKNASDNGILREGKGSPFEGGIRVPFAVRWPGKVPAGVDYKEPVISLDILATIVAEANVDTSANKPLDGTNLMPHLRGERSGPPHDILFWRGFDQKWFAARQANNKLVNKRAGKMLFDLETDISEADNLISTDAKTHQDLEKRVEAWNSEMIDPVFDKLGSWKLDNSKTAKKNKKGEET